MSFLLFIDGSVNSKTKVGFGAALLLTDKIDFEEKIILTKRFIETSSTKLELQTLLWAFSDLIQKDKKVTIFTDSQLILDLPARRETLENNDFRTAKENLLSNYELYKDFYQCIDEIDCEFVKIKGHRLNSQKSDLDKLFSLVDKVSRQKMRQELK